MATPMISAQNVHKSFGQLEVLKGIDLEVQPGEVACLLGLSLIHILTLPTKA